jgi:hypothetical protein
MAQLTTHPRGYLTLTNHLLTQVEQADALSLSEVTAQPGGGLLVSGAQSLQVIEHMKGRGYRAHLLPDRQLYKGKNRKLAGQPFTPNWISRQQRLGLPAIIPDAGYVAAGDLRGLRSVLQWSAAIPNAIGLLAVANWWMYDNGLRLLRQELHDIAIPVAIVLEHKGDPLSVQRILKGLVTLLRDGNTVLVFRCDVSAVGLLANGALAAAFGSKTSIRHLYPAANGGGGNPTSRESVFWTAGTALHYHDLIYDAVSASPHDPTWECWCMVCGGRRLDRLGFSPTEEIRQHNSAGLLSLRDELADVPAADRPRWWRNRCHDAQLAHTKVDIGPVALSCPQSLIRWQTI